MFPLFSHRHFLTCCLKSLCFSLVGVSLFVSFQHNVTRGGLIKALVLKLYSEFLLIRLVSSLSSLCEGRARAGKRSSL